MFEEKFLKTLAEDLINEYHHFYFYNNASINIKGLQREVYKSWLEDKALEELAHVREWQTILNHFEVPFDNIVKIDLNSTKNNINDILKEALELENEVVNNFNKRLQYLENLDNVSDDFYKDVKYLSLFLEDQLQDSYGDVIEIKKLLENCSK